MIYEIINMSDPYTIDAPSLQVAFVACSLLGNGQYGLRALESGGIDVPVFMFGGHEEWCGQQFGKGCDDVVAEVMSYYGSSLADCLDSCLIGKRQDRDTYNDGLRLIDDAAKRDEWREKWHDSRRSSLNDIGGRSRKLAIAIRKRDGTLVEKAPQQVFSV